MDTSPDHAIAARKARTRIAVSGRFDIGSDIVLPKAAAHHVRTVLRARLGDRVRIFNTDAGEALATLTALGKATTTVQVEHMLRPPAGEDRPDLWLAFAPIKRTALDFLIEKAVELGVTRLLPVLTRYTDAQKVRLDRLDAHASAATAQCERLDTVPVTAPVDLDKLLSTWPEDRPLLVAVESGAVEPLAVAAGDLPRPLKAGLLIGPEGGFAPAEVDLIRRARTVRAVGLGPRVLRSETAALTACAILQAVAGDFDRRPPYRE